MRYSVVVEKANENYSAYVPDLPGCVATGDTIEAVQREIRQAIGLHVQGLKEDGLTVPEPTSVVDYIDTGSETDQTAASLISNDVPIEKPEDDQYGIDAFAEAIAASIEKLFAPEGTVFALTGPWGSGKSSAVNLIRHHLHAAEEIGRLKIIEFNPWWYSNEELVSRAFFQHLYVGLGKVLSETGRKVILSLGKKLLGAGSLISSAVNLFTFGLGGRVAEQAASAAAEWIKTDRTAEEDYRALTEELRKQRSKFLVIIDDIDRLTPEQTLLIFRLVKSVGRLPNVVYLLVFDRDLAERLLRERYPAERHFLEKIVQAAFEVPLPDPEVLHGALLNALVTLAGHPEDDDGVRFRNILVDVVNPLIVLPRDLVRFMGNLSVSWAAIGDEVDFADLVAIEALRLFRFSVYQAIRTHKAMLCGTGAEINRQRGQGSTYDQIFLISAPDDRERDYLRTALRRLFPRLDSVWANIFHSSSAPIWRAKRLICDPSHFASYFKLTLGTGILPRKLFNDLLAHVDDRRYVQTFFRERSKATRKNGHSEVPIVLDDLTGLADKIPVEKTAAFLSALFEIADEVDLERDEQQGGFGFGSTQLRLHWLINALVRDRMPQGDRAILLRDVLKTASLGWAVDLTSRIYTDHHPRTPDKETPPQQRLVDSATAGEITYATLERIRRAAETGALPNARHLLYVLYRWREFADDGGVEVHNWTDTQLDNDEFVIRLADAVTSTVWVTSLGLDGMGDRVSRGLPQVQIDGLDSILNVNRFLSRKSEVEARLLAEHEKQILARFNEGMQRREEEQRRRGEQTNFPREGHETNNEDIDIDDELQQ